GVIPRGEQSSIDRSFTSAIFFALTLIRQASSPGCWSNQASQPRACLFLRNVWRNSLQPVVTASCLPFIEPDSSMRIARWTLPVPFLPAAFAAFLLSFVVVAIWLLSL